ncbi:IS1 transposase [compost metagenome]
MSSRHQPQYGSAPPRIISPKQVAENTAPKAEVVICCEADEHWLYVRYKGNPRWSFDTYDRIHKRALVHAFGPRNTLDPATSACPI